MIQKNRTVTLRIERELSDAIDEIQARYGTPISEQLRRGLRMWLESQGVHVKADRKRAATRKRS